MFRTFTTLFCRRKPKTIVNRRPPGRTQLAIELLENRLVPAFTAASSAVVQLLPPAGIVYDSLSKEVRITGSNLNDKVEWKLTQIPSGDLNTPPLSLKNVTLKSFDPNVSWVTPVKTYTYTLPGSVSRIVFYAYGGNDTYTNPTNIASYADGGEGNDLLQGSYGMCTFYGGGGNDTLQGGALSDVLYGGAGADQILGNDGADSIYGEAGNDSLYGGTGNDFIRGGGDNDLIHGESHNDKLYGDDGLDTVEGGTGADTLYGGDQDDTLTGGDGNDNIFGNGGIDYIQGNDGHDVIDGGASQDVIYGGMGDDTIHGGEGIDFLHGQWGNDWLYGDEGVDWLYGEIGDDVLDGGAGDDHVFGGPETYINGSDKDSLFGGAGDDELEGGCEDDVLDGEQGANTIHGGDGNDKLYGGDDKDILFGDAGYDSLWGGNGANLLNGGEGSDLLNGGDDADELYGEVGNDTLYGGGGDDTLDGGDWNDTLYGEAGEDWLFGGGGNDRLFGGGDYDWLFGEDGNDWLEAGSPGEYVSSGDGIDFNAYEWAVDGATFDDVNQEESPTCVFLSSLSAVAASGQDLAKGIVYLGDYHYQVTLFREDEGGIAVDVFFDGTFMNWSSQGPAFDGGDTWYDPKIWEGNFWTLLYQRAYHNELAAIDELDDFRNGERTLFVLTGRDVESDDWDAEDIRQHLLDGQAVIACQADDGGFFVDKHCYTVLDVFQANDGTWMIKLRNPWGEDAPVDADHMSFGDPNDGIIVTTWENFDDAFGTIRFTV